MSDLSQKIEGAIAAHRKWKARLQQATSTGDLEDYNVKDITAPNKCELGNMLESDIIPHPLRMTQEFIKAKTLHETFHVKTGAVFQLMISGKTDQAKAMFAGEWMKISLEVVQSLRTLAQKAEEMKL